MKEFIKQLLTNRLGIILATLNLCYLFSRPFFNAAAPHGDGSICFINHAHKFNCLVMQFSETMFNINIPALFLSIIPDVIIQSFSRTYVPENTFIQIALFAFFITIQWLFIGWTAKKTAFAIQSKLF